MIRFILYVLLFPYLFLGSCQSSTSPNDVVSEVDIQEVAVPTIYTSGEPNLFVSKSGQLYLSWVEELDDAHRLQYARWEGERWSPPQTIAQGEGWFVNWADFPSVAVTDSFGVAHYLQKSAEGTYDYDIQVTLSGSEHNDWGSPTVLHQDHVAAEHGFVTLLPLSPTEILSVWLDGRQTKQENGAMNLYTNVIGSSGTSKPGYCLDSRVCDCCQTDAALTSEGPIVVYRNRTDEEIRDIYVVRQTAGGWSQPYPLHNDNWQIAGCPVNGPAISTYQNAVAVAWFTAANDIPKVQVVFSDNQGESFGEPITLSQHATLGRVDIEMLDENTAVVSWMDHSDGKAVIKMMSVRSSGLLGLPVTLTEVAASRSSGFPIIAYTQNRVFCAYTQVSDSTTNVQTTWIATEDL